MTAPTGARSGAIANTVSRDLAPAAVTARSSRHRTIREYPASVIVPPCADVALTLSGSNIVSNVPLTFDGESSFGDAVKAEQAHDAHAQSHPHRLEFVNVERDRPG